MLKLSAMENTTEALAKGDISMAKASVLARAGLDDKKLIGVAATNSLAATREAAERARQSERNEYESARKRRYFMFKKDGKYSTEIHGRFLNEEIAELKIKHDKASAEAFRNARKLGRRDSQSTYDADGFVAATASGGSSKPLNTHVNVVVNYETLIEGALRPNDFCEIPNVGYLPVDVVERMMQDSLLRVLLMKGKDVLALGTESRYIPAAVKASLNINAKVCGVNGCDVTVGLELDHNQEIQDGGRSKLKNLGYLCRFHHYLKTHKGYRLQGDPGGYELIPPADVNAPMLL